MTVSVPADQAERARGELAELAPEGWSEQVDGGEAVGFELWFGADDDVAVERLRNELDRRGVNAAVAATPQDDAWKDALRRHHVPVSVGGRIRIRPPWVAPEPGMVDIVIDPGMAFGTGQHATTRACLAFLLDAPPGSVLDVGCGSGVLAIAARKLGHDPVHAVDVDPLAIDATARNARANRVVLDAMLGDGVQDQLPECDTVLANVTAGHVATLAGALRHRPALAILSGFRPDQFDEAIAPWRDRGYRLARRIDEDGWSAVALTLA